jgi:CheY-like chemotaxis protein
MRLAGLILLVVEDDPDNLELVSSHLEGEGATVLSAASIAAALSMSHEQGLSALLSDLELPDGNGCDLLRQLRARDGKDLPAIALTGYSDNKWRTRAANCGFDRYALKPFSLEQLTDWLGELVIDRKSGVDEATCHAARCPTGLVRQGR